MIFFKIDFHLPQLCNARRLTIYIKYLNSISKKEYKHTHVIIILSIIDIQLNFGFFQ